RSPDDEGSGQSEHEAGLLSDHDLSDVARGALERLRLRGGARADPASSPCLGAAANSARAIVDSGGYVDSWNKQIVFSYAHPIFLGPCTLLGIGDRQVRCGT